MPGNRWTDEEQAAYRSTLTLDRLRDEGWIVVSILYLCAASQIDEQDAPCRAHRRDRPAEGEATPTSGNPAL